MRFVPQMRLKRSEFTPFPIDCGRLEWGVKIRLSHTLLGFNILLFRNGVADLWQWVVLGDFQPGYNGWVFI